VVSPIAALGVAVPVIAGFIGGETPSTLQTVGLVIALVGAVATSGPELSGGASARSVGLAAFAGICFGTVFLAVDQGAKSSALMTLVGMRTTSIVMFGIAAIALRTIGGLDRTDLFPLFVIGFFDVAANLMYALASNRGYVSIVSVLASLYPVMTVLLARAVLHERLRAVQLVGVVVTLSGVAFISAGCSGHVTLELSNVATLPIKLWPGMKIGQLCFFRLSSPAENPYGSAKYGSRYQGQRGPTPSRSFQNFHRTDI
jgi:drug/metabolite transporter (DMT)-like permease